MSTDTFEDTLRDLLRDTADAAGPGCLEPDADRVIGLGRRVLRRRRWAAGLVAASVAGVAGARRRAAERGGRGRHGTQDPLELDPGAGRSHVGRAECDTAHQPSRLDVGPDHHTGAGARRAAGGCEGCHLPLGG